MVAQRATLSFSYRIAATGTNNHASWDSSGLGFGIFTDLINGLIGGGEMMSALRAEVSGLDGFPAAWADHSVDYGLGHILLPALGAELGVRGERCAALGTLGLGLGSPIEREIKQKPVDTHAQEIRKTCADAEVTIIVIPGDKVVKAQGRERADPEDPAYPRCLPFAFERCAVTDTETVDQDGDAVNNQTE